jgi:hypothetical protein
LERNLKGKIGHVSDLIGVSPVAAEKEIEQPPIG